MDLKPGHPYIHSSDSRGGGMWWAPSRGVLQRWLLQRALQGGWGKGGESVFRAGKLLTCMAGLMLPSKLIPNPHGLINLRSALKSDWLLLVERASHPLEQRKPLAWAI